MKKLFIDTNILLDLLLTRTPHFEAAARLFSFIESGKARGFVSALTFANLHYMLRQAFSETETLKQLRKVRVLLQIVPISEKIVDHSLASEFKDFEDALQNYTVLENDLDCLITRNKRDFKRSAIPLYTAEEYLSALSY